LINYRKKREIPLCATPEPSARDRRPMSRPQKVRNALQATRNVAGLIVVDYPRQMLETGHDDELAATLATAPENELDYLGVAAHGLSQVLDGIFGRFSLWQHD
jgi:hypothetical protein